MLVFNWCVMTKVGSDSNLRRVTPWHHYCSAFRGGKKKKREGKQQKDKEFTAEGKETILCYKLAVAGPTLKVDPVFNIVKQLLNCMGALILLIK